MEFELNTVVFFINYHQTDTDWWAGSGPYGVGQFCHNGDRLSVFRCVQAENAFDVHTGVRLLPPPSAQ